MRRSIRQRSVVIVGVISIGAVLSLAACAPSPEAPSSSPTPGASEPEPYAGPVVFVGDELDAFALTPQEIVGIVPDAADIGDLSSVLPQVSDGGGMAAVPAICDVLYAEQSLGTVGARTIEWTVPTDPVHGSGRLLVLQFADEAQAQARMDQLMQASEQCSEFDKGGAVTFDAVIPEESGDARAFAGTLDDPGLGWRSFDAFASTGNVIVQLQQPLAGEGTLDAEAAARVLQARAAEARSGLIAALTDDPPVAEEDPSGDPGAVWSEWQIGVGGVGPLRLGDDVDAALAAAGDAEVVDPAYDGGPWTLVDADRSGSIQVQPVDDGDSVWKVIVGNARSLDEAAQDGSALPARGDVRVGAPVADAIAAFPGGTTVEVQSSGDHLYAVTNRDGQVFAFLADRDVLAEGSTIVGITVEDATARTGAVFG